MENNAIEFLLQSRHKAPGVLQRGNRLYHLTWLLPLATGMMLVSPTPPNGWTELILGIIVFGCSMGLVASMAIPLVQRLARNTSLHTSLLKNQSYPDLLMNGVEPSQLVDAITRDSLSEVWPRVGGSALLAYCLGCGFFAAQLNLSSSGHVGRDVVAAALTPTIGLLSLLLGSLLLTIWFGYVSQWNLVARFFSNARTSLIQFLLLVLFPALMLQMHDFFSFFGTGAIFYTASLLAIRAAVIRHITGLNSLQESMQPGRSRRGSVNPWLLQASDNPIVYRHSVQQASRVGGGPLRAALTRFPMALVMLVALPVLVKPVEALWGFWVLLCGLQFLRTAGLSSLAVSSEFQQRTLEPLTCTPTDNKSFYRGWAQAILGPIAKENVALTAVTLAGLVAAVPGPQLLWHLPLLLGASALLQFASMVAFTLGFYCSCQPITSTSQSRLFEHLLAVCILIPLATFYSGAIVGGLFQFSSPSLPLMVAAGVGVNIAGLAWIARFYYTRAILWLNTDHGRDVSGYDPKDRLARKRRA